MNWRQNKFLIGFGIVMLIACGVLGYLIFQASSHFSELSDQFDTQSAELQRLQNLPLYPEQGNLAKLEKQKQTATENAIALQQQLAPMSIPLDAITPEQFQDKLRATVSSVIAKAQAAGVKLPERFYLGFDKYQNEPPKTEAASPLDRQLKVIQLTVETLIDSKVDELDKIERAPLPEEGDSARIPPRQNGAAAPRQALVSRYPFAVDFSAEQRSFRRVLNELSKNGKQFLILHPRSIKNDNDKPMSKADTTKTEQPAVAGQAPVAPDPSKESLHYIVGTEKLNVSLGLDMVVFASASSK